MTTIHLTLTEDEAEILGYALSLAKRDQDAKAEAARHGSNLRAGCQDRAWRIERVRMMLDCAPAAP